MKNEASLLSQREQGGSGKTAAFKQGDWRLTLPADWTVIHRDKDGSEMEIPLREHPALAKYASKDEAVKALVHAQKLIGKGPEEMEGWIRVPGEGDGPDRWEALYAALGRPDSAEGYELPEFELPDGFDLDTSLSDDFRRKGYELGLTPTQVKGLYQWFLPLNVEAMLRMQQEENEGLDRHRTGELDRLRKEHGGGVGGVLDQARQAVLALGGETLLDALDRSGAGDRAEVINAFAKVAPLILEGRFKGGGADNGPGMTKARLREMMRDPRYLDPVRRDPDFVAQVTRGFEALYPGEYTQESRG